MSTLPVIEEILREAEHPMSVREIVEVAGNKLPTKSKTPDTVVARDLSMDIKKKGDGSRFVRTSPGRYAIREKAETWQRDEAVAAPSQPAAQPGAEAATPVLGNAIAGERAATIPARTARRAETSEDTSVPA
jgi:hypothetical protein